MGSWMIVGGDQEVLQNHNAWIPHRHPEINIFFEAGVRKHKQSRDWSRAA